VSDVRRSPGRQGIEEEGVTLAAIFEESVLLGGHCSYCFDQGTRELTEETWSVLLAAIGGNKCRKRVACVYER